MRGDQDFRWGIWLTVLSLDATEQFHDEMRVPVPKAYFTGLMRDHVRTHRSAMAQDILPSNEALIEVVLSDITRLQPDKGPAFQVWFRDIATFQWGERPEWAPWDVILRDWGFGRQPGRLSEQLWFQQMLHRFMSIMAFRELRARTEMARRGPLSDWDAEMFALHRLYEIEGEDSGFDPFSPVFNTIEFLRLQKFYIDALPNLNSEQIVMLNGAARETAARIDYPLGERFVTFGQLTIRSRDETGLG